MYREPGCGTKLPGATPQVTRCGAIRKRKHRQQHSFQRLIMGLACLSRLFNRKGRRDATKPRKPHPLDPAWPCPISRLSDNIILHIFSFVQADSPHSMLNLALVHPHFYHHARYVQHYRVVFDLYKSETLAGPRSGRCTCSPLSHNRQPGYVEV